MVCPRCKSGDVLIQTVADVHTRRRGCLGWAWWIFLACVTFGLILIIPLMTNSRTKTRLRTLATCQSCGKRWRA